MNLMKSYDLKVLDSGVDSPGFELTLQDHLFCANFIISSFHHLTRFHHFMFFHHFIISHLQGPGISSFHHLLSSFHHLQGPEISSFHHFIIYKVPKFHHFIISSFTRFRNFIISLSLFIISLFHHFFKH